MKYKVKVRQTVYQIAEFEFKPPFTLAELASESEETLLGWACEYAWAEAEKHFREIETDHHELTIELI